MKFCQLQLDSGWFWLSMWQMMRHIGSWLTTKHKYLLKSNKRSPDWIVNKKFYCCFFQKRRTACQWKPLMWVVPAQTPMSTSSSLVQWEIQGKYTWKSPKPTSRHLRKILLMFLLWKTCSQWAKSANFEFGMTIKVYGLYHTFSKSKQKKIYVK